MNELIALIEDAEQGGTLQQVEDGRAARAELNAIIAAAEKLASVMYDLLTGYVHETSHRHGVTREQVYDISVTAKRARAALAEWEATK